MNLNNVGAFSVVVGFLDLKDVSKLRSVQKTWLKDKDIERIYQRLSKKLISEVSFGPEDWQTYFNHEVSAISEKYPLRKDIIQILHSKCLFRSGKKVIETQWLYFDPGFPTLNSLRVDVKTTKLGN